MITRPFDKTYFFHSMFITIIYLYHIDEHYPCLSSPCMNGGHCLDAQKLPAVSFDAHGYKCNCDHGFAGRNCEGL